MTDSLSPAPLQPVADEQVEQINRRAASARRYFADMFAPLLPLELTSFHYSPLENYIRNPWHTHSHIELEYVLYGEAEWRTKSSELVIEEGQLLVLPLKLIHHRRCTARQGQLLSLHCHPREDAWPTSQQIEFWELVYRHDFVFTLEPDLRKKMNEITAVLLSSEPLRERLAAVLLGEIILRLFRRYFVPTARFWDQASESRPSTTDFQEQVYLQAVKYVTDNLRRPLTLDEIARTCGVSSRHLNRIFVQYGGTTVGRHLLKRRVDRSFSMLQESQATIADIAAQLGFADAAHFIRSFRRFTGLSPGEYRKRLPHRERFVR